jgi:hypothetical protein
MAENAVALRGISELRGYFRTNQTPIYFISPTAFNLLGIDRWVRNFHYVNYFDSFDDRHPCVFVPSRGSHDPFGSIEDVCNHLLTHDEVRKFVGSQRPRGTGPAGKTVFVFFEEESERLAEEIGLEVALPSAELRHRLDSKIVTTRIGDDAGVPSVPNVLGRAASHEELLELAASAGLGEDLVVQTPYGDSGKTTFFIRGERDWNAAADEMAGQELKVMRRIIPRAVAVEACITRHGTVVGPLMIDLTGYPELTPYRGGWCGNDIFPGALSLRNRELAIDYTRRLGDRLAKEGYLGLLEVDYLVDVNTDQIYLGELNPRLSGISSMTTVSASAYADMPLFLFHLAEYLDLDYEVDVDEINRRWGSDRLTDVWGQIILKEPDDVLELLTETPRSGIWRLDEETGMTGGWPADDWHNLRDESEGFYLRILGPGDHRYRGADLGILVTRTRMQTDDGQLTARCRRWIDAIRSQFAGTPVEPTAGAPAHDALAFKSA